jgi:SM-20-related protein
MPESDGSAHFHLFLLRNFLDPDSCVSLIAELAAAPSTQAPVYIAGAEGTVHESVRKTTSLHPSDETIARLRERLFRHQPALEQHFGTSLTDCERPQFLRYRTGDFFVRHQDGDAGQSDFDHLRARRISIVVFLNDAYSGGALTFHDEATTFALTGETGLMVAFRAETFHEVLPVTSGERFTVVSWFR